MHTTQYLKDIFREQGPRSRFFAAAQIFTALDQYLPWLAARRFKGAIIKDMGDGWLLIVRGAYGRKDQVAFFPGNNPEECIVEMAYELLFDLVKWKADKWPTTRIDKTG